MSVNLQKGQKISLSKEGGGDLSSVVMGLGWDAMAKKGLFGFSGGTQEIDLAASCLLFDENRSLLDSVWFRQLRSRDGSIQHSVQGTHSAQIMAKVYRHSGEWKMHAIGENGTGRTFTDLMPQILPHI